MGRVRNERMVLRNDSAEPAQEAALHLHPVRARILSIEARDAEVKRIGPFTWRAMFDVPVPSQQVVAFGVSYVGEPVSVQLVEWGDSGQFAAIEAPEPLDYVSQRRVLVERMSGPKQSYANYFRLLDEAISDIGTQVLVDEGVLTAQERADRLNLLDEAILILFDRMKARWDAVNTAANVMDHTVPDESSLPVMDVAKIQSLSTLQLGIIDEVFGPSSDAWHSDTNASAAEKIQSAYEWFASGRLVPPVNQLAWGGQPDSAQIFMFAEFAFMAIHNQVDASKWLRLANVLVRAQRIYRLTYDSGWAPCYPWYSPPQTPPAPVLSDQDLLVLRESPYDAQPWWTDATDRTNRLPWLLRRMGMNLYLYCGGGMTCA